MPESPDGDHPYRAFRGVSIKQKGAGKVDAFDPPKLCHLHEDRCQNGMVYEMGDPAEMMPYVYTCDTHARETLRWYAEQATGAVMVRFLL